MSLRHSFPEFEVIAANHLIEPHRTPPRLVSPEVVEFRTGGDLGAVVAAVNAARYVRVDAAVGTGKSVRLPGELVKGLNKLVIHIVPSRLLAHDLYKYVSTIITVPICEFVDVKLDLPKVGLVIMSNATYLAKAAFYGAEAMPPHVLYMDEAHESDCATSVIRESALSKLYVESLVLASATANPEGFRRRETAGEVTVLKYPANRTPATWNASDLNMPWSADAILCNAMFFVEREREAIRLIADYSDYGFNCFRLTSKTSVAEFDAIRATLSNPIRGVSIVFADYSFRSGFTLPIQLVIDGNEVGFVIVDNGSTSKRFRRAYAGEREQAVGRVGRLPGTKAKAYVPDIEPEGKICDLEGVESDAATLLMRYMGHKPSAAMRSSPFSIGDVPNDLVSALNGPMPLRLLPTTSLSKWPGVTSRDLVPIVDVRNEPDNGLLKVREHSNRSTPMVTPRTSPRIEAFDNGEAVDKLQQLQAERVVDDIGNVQVPLVEVITATDATVTETDQGSKAAKSDEAAMDIFETMLKDAQLVNSQIQIGKYYYYPGIETRPTDSIAFPKGVKSVLHMSARSDFPTVVAGLSEVDMLHALGLVLDAYNNATTELVVIKRIIAMLPMYKQQYSTMIHQASIKGWISDLAETLTVCSSLVSQFSKILLTLSDDGFEEIEMREVEDALIQQYVTRLVTIMRDVEKVGAVNYKTRLKASVRSTNVDPLEGRYIKPLGYGDGQTDSHVRRMLAPRTRSAQSIPTMDVKSNSAMRDNKSKWTDYLTKAMR